jgi:hypothetical protein
MANPADRFGVMIVDVNPKPSANKAADSQRTKVPDRQPGNPAGGSTTDEMSEFSFPASDPPSVWTWEIKPQTDASGVAKSS